MPNAKNDIAPVDQKPDETKTSTPVITDAAPLPEPTPSTAAAPVGSGASVAAVVAVSRIDGTIEPGTMFRPKTDKLRVELFRLEAVRDLTEAESALFAKLEDEANPLG